MDKSTYDCMAYIIRTLLDYGDDQLYENYKATNDISMLRYKKYCTRNFPN